MGTDRFPFPQRSYTHILIALFCSQTHSRSFPRYLESITSMMFRLTPQDDKTSETPRTRSTGPMVLVTSFLRQAGVPPMDSKTWASGSPARSGTPLYRSTAMTVRSQDRTEEMLMRHRLTTKALESRGRILAHFHARQHGGSRVTCVLLISFLLMSQLSQVALASCCHRICGKYNKCTKAVAVGALLATSCVADHDRIPNLSKGLTQNGAIPNGPYQMKGRFYQKYAPPTPEPTPVPVCHDCEPPTSKHVIIKHTENKELKPLAIVSGFAAIAGIAGTIAAFLCCGGNRPSRSATSADLGTPPTKAAALQSVEIEGTDPNRRKLISRLNRSTRRGRA